MNTKAEVLVWKLASECYGAGLGQLLAAAIGSYKRPPGLDGLTRIYAENIGADGLKVLVDTLVHHATGRFYVSHGGVEIRLGLRGYLLWFLRQKLVDDGHAQPQ
ncbi:hypothetical protein NJC38_02835 [Pseudomonas sp. 21LCFQ010]|uniref:hypothetical protein n=1 Tax=Pseudomonas sp. 21LCFQ010 TaxID=2957506 RepID=UPI002096FA48|nr:hypothetical protein [Pseudomonas sp. 21LCFQ010]MCO8161087.1 hypothetical protein [Pseudomonas sp. 21LCFQ010]